MAINSFFDVMNVIFEKKAIPTNEEIDKHCNQYMMNMLLSCDQQFTEIAHVMSIMKISNKEYFDCLYYGLPKGKRYIPYNAKKTKKDQEVLYVMDYFKCSQQVAKDYLNVLDENELKTIITFYEKRGIKK